MMHAMKNFTQDRLREAAEATQVLVKEIDQLGFALDPGQMVTMRLDMLTDFVIGKLATAHHFGHAPSEEELNEQRQQLSLELETNFTELLRDTLTGQVSQARQAALRL